MTFWVWTRPFKPVLGDHRFNWLLFSVGNMKSWLRLHSQKGSAEKKVCLNRNLRILLHLWSSLDSHWVQWKQDDSQSFYWHNWHSVSVTSPKAPLAMWNEERSTGMVFMEGKHCCGVAERYRLAWGLRFWVYFHRLLPPWTSRAACLLTSEAAQHLKGKTVHLATLLDFNLRGKYASIPCGH